MLTKGRILCLTKEEFYVDQRKNFMLMTEGLPLFVYVLTIDFAIFLTEEGFSFRLNILKYINLD